MFWMLKSKPFLSRYEPQLLSFIARRLFSSKFVILSPIGFLKLVMIYGNDECCHKNRFDPSKIYSDKASLGS